QEWGPSAPPELWSSCRLRWEPGLGPTVGIEAVWAGSPSGLGPYLDTLSAMVGTAPSRSVTTKSYLDAALYLAGCEGLSMSHCRLVTQSPVGRLKREASLARSDFFDRPISGGVERSLLGSIAARG